MPGPFACQALRGPREGSPAAGCRPVPGTLAGIKILVEILAKRLARSYWKSEGG
jgi:hypothetical protein